MNKAFTLAIVIGFLCLCSCVTTKQESTFNVLSADTEKTILEKKVHELTWREYQGYGDKEKAAFILDGFEIGKGSEGLTALKSTISKMKEGSVVKIIPYYGDPGSEKRLEYPFDSPELYRHAEKYGILLGIPGPS